MDMQILCLIINFNVSNVFYCYCSEGLTMPAIKNQQQTHNLVVFPSSETQQGKIEWKTPRKIEKNGKEKSTK